MGRDNGGKRAGPIFRCAACGRRGERTLKVVRGTLRLGVRGQSVKVECPCGWAWRSRHPRALERARRQDRERHGVHALVAYVAGGAL